MGCGYLGTRLASYWQRRGETVWASTRSEKRAEEFRRLGLKPIVLDVTSPNLPSLPDVDTVVFAVGFDRSTSQSIHKVYVEGLRNVLQACPASVKRFIYVSSTGVFGHTQGECVDENTPCQPSREGGKACLAAEKLISSWPGIKDKAIILRLAGIYGPERLPLLKKLQTCQPLAVAAEGSLNLVHVDDIVRIVDTCAAKISPPNLFCVADGNPVQRATFYECLAELVDCPAPTFSAPEPGSPRAERARGSKKVRNDRLLSHLNYEFLYPSYREGLKAIVDSTY